VPALSAGLLDGRLAGCRLLFGRGRWRGGEIGGFLGAWLGGKVFEATGSYNWIWYVDIMLALGAALVHLPISEEKPHRAGTAGAT
jgi:hypothetical protein